MRDAMGRFVVLAAVIGFVLAGQVSSAAATALPTSITTNMTLTSAGSPYTGTSVTIEPGVTVEAQPGTVVKLSGSLNVNGTLTALGTSEAAVLFTSASDLAPGEWSGIKLNSGAGASDLSHAVVRYATTGITISGSSPTVTASSVSGNKTAGITVSGGQPKLVGNTLDADGVGIEFSGSPDIGGNTIRDCRGSASAIRQSSSAAKTNQIKVHDNLVERCGNSSTAAISVPGTAVTLGGNTVRESKGQAISYGNTPTNTVIPPDIAENTLENNAGNAIWVNGEVTESATWKGHGFPIVAMGGSDTITVGPNATLVLEPGLAIKIAQFNATMIVRGTLRAAGTAENPVRFTALNDDAVGGDTNMDGSATTPVAGEYIGVRFVEGSSTAPPGRGELDHVVATYGGAPASCGQCGGGGPMFSFGGAASGGPAGEPSSFENSRLEKTVRAAINLSGKPIIADNLLTETSGIEFSGSPDIDGNTIEDCRESAAAIRQSSSAAKTTQSKVHDNLVERCGNSSTAAISVPGTAVTMSGNTVRESKGKAISYGNTPTNTIVPPDIAENTLENNAGNAIWVNGELTESATWKDHGFPIVAMGGSDTVTVGAGVTLKLEPGLAIKIAQFNATMIVRGTLWADGTAEDPVLLTSFNDDAVGGDTNMDGNATTPVAGEYIGVRFVEGSATAPPGRGVLDHLNATYGGAPASCGLCGGGGPLFNFGGPASGGPVGEPSLIAHSRLEQTVRKAVTGPGGPKLEDDFLFKTPGLEFSGAGSPEVSESTIKDCNESSAAIIQAGGTSKGSVRIHGNTVERCGNSSSAAIKVSGSGLTGLTLGGNAIRESDGQAIDYSGDIPPDLVDNTVENNASDEIWVSGTLNQSATWHNARAIVRVNGSITIPAGVTLTITEGVFLRNPKMTVNGTLKALGSAQKPVVFTGLKEEAGGEWGGINLEATSGSSVIDYAEIAYGGSGGPMLNVKGASPTITHSTFRRSSGDGIRVQQSGHPTVEGNRFRNNNFGLRYEGEGKLLAPNNDWGCANGPKPTGCGDQVTSNVEWKPAVTLQELPRLCPGSTMSATSNRCLLSRYEPALFYDTDESYYADSAAEITNNWGDEETGYHGENKLADPYSNSLWDGDSEKESPNFGLLAQSQPGVTFLPFQLTPSALGSTYPNGQAADTNDWLGENENFQQDNERLERAGYLDAVYGRAFADGSGKRWLEYWYWYYYNPKDFAGIGHHQGDWESVVVQLDEHSKPEAVILSQHTGAASCDMEQIERSEEGAPVVYVGLDSHANYPSPGRYEATGEFDHADGSGRSAYPGLVVIENSPPSWLSWPGHWGNSRAEVSPVESDSPTGPAFHHAWEDPVGYSAEAGGCFDNYVGPDGLVASGSSATAPSIESATLVADEPVVEYEVPKADGKGFWPRLRITVDRLADGGAAPASRTISAVRAKGALRVPIELEPGEEAELRGSLVYADGRRVHLRPKRVRFGEHRKR